MSIKNKTALIISILFTIIYIFSATIIYTLFSDFRKDEFESRLKEKAVSSIKLLVEVEQIDKQLLKQIDQNSIHRLYDEKTLIFDANFRLIYSSLDDTKINWSIDDLKKLKKNKFFFRKDKEKEVYGVFYDTNDKDYYALISAKDNYGKRKLEYLIYILVCTYLILTSLTWFLSYQIIRRVLRPIDDFLKKIKSISEDNLDTRIDINEKKDEIDLLAIEFNDMLERINNSYKKQQEFTSNASHELRTPLARLSAQIENKIIEENLKNNKENFYNNLLKDVNQLSELTDSLLLLSKIDKDTIFNNEICRIDEIIFENFEKINQFFPDYKMDFIIDEIENIEIFGNKKLLDIAFFNLFKNAYLYSDNKIVTVRIFSNADSLSVEISNDGKTLSSDEKDNLFEPFSRGKNSKNISGLGLGLRIVKRILNQQNAKINYFVSIQNKNVFLVELK